MRGKVKVAIIGVGRVGNSHIQAILKLPDIAELGGIVDINKAAADRVASQFKTKAFYSVEDALMDQSIDAFVVCLPHDLHAPIGLQIMKAGRHVLIEKPLGINLDEVKQLINVSNEHQVNVMSGQSRRFYKAIQQAKEFLSIIDGPTNMLYNFACIFTKESAPPWWQKEDKTGGLVLSMLGSHSIDMALWMFDKKPVRLYCESRRFSTVFEGDDAAVITMKFEDGSIATNYLSISNSPLKHECLIEGRNGTIQFDHKGDHEGVIGTSHTNVYVNGKLMETSDEPDCFTLQMEEFTTSILEKRQPSTSAQKVYPTYLLVEAAKNSAQTHLPIHFSANDFNIG